MKNFPTTSQWPKLYLIRSLASLSAAPTSFDPEDDVNEETTARVESQYDADNSENEDELTSHNLSHFRKQNVELLEEVDKRYEGKRASRKKLLGQSEREIEEEGSEKSSSESSESDGDEESSAEESEEYDSNDEEKDLDDNEKRNIFKDVGKVSNSKSACVRQQLGMWESFLEMRIQLQKSLLTANKMPQSAMFLDIENNATADFDLEIRNKKNCWHRKKFTRQIFAVTNVIVQKLSGDKKIVDKR